MVDEQSQDDTPHMLKSQRVHYVAPPEALGVTHQWNMAYKYFKQSSHQHLFLSNNDVLIPDGVLTKLAAAMDPNGEEQGVMHA